MFTPEDHAHMRAALALAERGLFITTPNPRVGCVIVRHGVVIGQGHTQPAGHNHAEVEALADARRGGHDPAGATVYVTLEPCSHFGRTPPCVNALIEARVGLVIAAMEDPNPRVAGSGLAALRHAGIEVRCGLLEREAFEMNIGFIARMTRGRPWVRLKSATSIDGHPALLNGVSQWITGPAARADGHAWRARACAILTGSGTVRRDDPLLTVREVATPRQPPAVLVDSRLLIDLDAKLVRRGGLLVFAARPDPVKERELADRGCEVVLLPNADHKVDLAAMVDELGRREINELHVEAGSRLGGALIRAGVVDELLLYVAPSLLGEAMPMFDLPALQTLEARQTLRFQSVAMVGDDLRVLARFVRAAAAAAAAGGDGAAAPRGDGAGPVTGPHST